jgi:hypothetical protein
MHLLIFLYIFLLTAAVTTTSPPQKIHKSADEERQRLLREFQATHMLPAAFIPQRGRLINALADKFCVIPKWLRFRGIRPLRKVTRHPLFDQILYLAIIVNMYVLTLSDVRTSECLYTYDAATDQDVLGKEYTLSLSSAQEGTMSSSSLNSNATMMVVPPGATLNGECIRGAKLLNFDSSLGAIQPGDPKYILALGNQLNDLSR